ncbi:MAG: [NiFe]-hydrogenase assembly, chaperone, HybE [Magnetospirillum sp.]|nr:MAG: [NiFe]-hydrogenase assembly, chaperone, HybE [Magnetospirillum sp.]
MAAPLVPQDAARVDTLVAVFTRIGEERMKDLSLYNGSLTVEAVGFRTVNFPSQGDWLAGILVTPWFMNLMLLPPSPETFAGVEPGTRRKIALPKGEETFVVNEIEEVGSYAALSIHSPMGQFPEHNAAATAAWAVVESYFLPPSGETPQDCSFGWPEHKR